ncbi:hypothetical protein D3C77_510100 [compost metagenome]
MADMVDDFDHRAIDRVVEHVFDKTSVDFQEVYRQMLQIRERRHPGTEVIQGEPAAQAFEFVDKAYGAAQVGDGAGFGDLEANHLRRDGIFTKQAPQVLKELIITNATARQVDRAHGQGAWAPFVQALTNDGEDATYHPTIKGGHQTIAFRGRNEAVGENDAPAFILQTQEDLNMPGPLIWPKGSDFLGI